MIPQETIDRIFEAARIEEIVRDFVQLKKAGVNYKGRCPFHDEKTRYRDSHHYHDNHHRRRRLHHHRLRYGHIIAYTLQTSTNSVFV